MSLLYPYVRTSVVKVVRGFQRVLNWPKNAGIFERDTKILELSLKGIANVHDSVRMTKHWNINTIRVGSINVETMLFKNMKLTPKEAKTRRWVLFIHGGAFIIMRPSSYRALCHEIGSLADACIMAPDYSLSPKALFPTSLDECVATYKYMLNTLQIPPENIAICGDSAGGNLALTTFLKAVGTEGLPAPACMMLMSPWIDLSASQASTSFNHENEILLDVPAIHRAAWLYLEGKFNFHQFESQVGDPNNTAQQTAEAATKEAMKSGGILEHAKARAAELDFKRRLNDIFVSPASPENIRKVIAQVDAATSADDAPGGSFHPADRNENRSTDRSESECTSSGGSLLCNPKNHHHTEAAAKFSQDLQASIESQVGFTVRSKGTPSAMQPQKDFSSRGQASQQPASAASGHSDLFRALRLLPPTLVQVASHEALCSEGVAFAAAANLALGAVDAPADALAGAHAEVGVAFRGLAALPPHAPPAWARELPGEQAERSRWLDALTPAQSARFLSKLSGVDPPSLRTIPLRALAEGDFGARVFGDNKSRDGAPSLVRIDSLSEEARWLTVPQDKVQVHLYHGMFHVFQFLHPVDPTAERAVREIAQFIKSHTKGKGERD